MTASGQVRFSFPSFRVFVHGVDVTNDVISCMYTWHDERSPGTAQFVLSSELNRYTITQSDIHALYDDITISEVDSTVLSQVGFQVPEADQALLAGTSASAKTDAESIDEVSKAIHARLQKEIPDEIKRRVLESKFDKRILGREQKSLGSSLERAIRALRDDAREAARNKKSSVQKVAALTGDFLRFPFQCGQCIFHTGDAVRIFWRDPFSPLDWYFAFTGVVSDWSESLSENGVHTVTITVEDALRPFRHARLTTNWAIFDVKALSDPKRDALFRTWKEDKFSDLTLFEMLFLMTFGITGAGESVAERIRDQSGRAPTPGDLSGVIPLSQFRYGVNGTSGYAPREEGVGAYNLKESRVFKYGPENVTGTSDSVTVPVEFGGGGQVTNREFVQFREVAAGNVIVEKLDSLEDWQRVIDHKLPSTIDELLTLCLPESRNEIRASLNAVAEQEDGFIDPEIVMSLIGENPHIFPVDFGRLLILTPASLGPATNREILLRDFVQSISTTTTFITRLSIIYNVCQRLDFSFYATPRGDVVCEMPLYSFRPENFGKYASRYIYPIFDTTKVSSSFSDEKVRTQFRIDPWILKNRTFAGNTAQLWQEPATVTLDALISQFGVRFEQGDPWGYINTFEAAEYFAHLKLCQLNADAWTEKVDVVMHIGVGPNRPCYFEVRDFIATTRTITNSIVWGMGGSVTQELKTNYRRGWSGNMTPEGNHAYEGFGGAMAHPIDYALLFEDRLNSVNTSTKRIEHASNTPEHDHDHEVEAEVVSEEVKRKNEALVEADVEKIRQRLNQELGTNIPNARAIMGSTTRTVQENRDVGGEEKSFHLSGLAVDIPVSQIGQYTKSDGQKLSGDDVAQVMRQMRREGAIDGSVIWKREVRLKNGETKLDHTDHVHFGRGESRRKRSHERGT